MKRIVLYASRVVLALIFAAAFVTVALVFAAGCATAPPPVLREPVALLEGNVFVDEDGVEWEGAVVHDGSRYVAINARGGLGAGLLVLASFGGSWGDCPTLSISADIVDVPTVAILYESLPVAKEQQASEAVGIRLDYEGLLALSTAQDVKIAQCDSLVVLTGAIADSLNEWATRSLLDPAPVGRVSGL